MTIEDYHKMKGEISNELSLSFHQLLMDNLNATNLARKENQESEKNLTNRINEVNEKVDRNHEETKQMREIFNNASGAFNVTKWFFIALGIFGAGLGGLYLLINEFKNFWRTH